MPLIRIQTNASTGGDDGEALIAEASRTVADELGKPERYVMVVLEPGIPMMFAGTTQPAAYLELRSIGLGETQTAALSRSLCQLVERRLGIPPDRTFISFADVPAKLWGWNGGTF